MRPIRQINLDPKPNNSRIVDPVKRLRREAHPGKLLLSAMTLLSLVRTTDLFARDLFVC